MAKTGDYQKQAADFMRLWQESMTKQMTDPETIRAMLAAMQSFGVPPHDAPTRNPAPAPDADYDAIRQLSERIGKLERTVDAISARLDAAKKPAGASKRPHAKSVAKPKQPVGRRKPAAAKKRVPAKRKK